MLTISLRQATSDEWWDRRFRLSPVDFLQTHLQWRERRQRGPLRLVRYPMLVRVSDVPPSQ
jgi:hypothetical protein